MKSIFKPYEILAKYSDFAMDKYRKLGFDTILLDVDNTITPYFEKIPNESGKAFVRRLKEEGFDVIVFSNNKKARVAKVAEAIDCEYVCWAFKPLPFKMNKTIKKLHKDKTKVLCMGDQLMTDILGGNLAGICAIYVKPISEVDTFTTSINRFFERKVFKYILHEKV